MDIVEIDSQDLIGRHFSEIKIDKAEGNVKIQFHFFNAETYQRSIITLSYGVANVPGFTKEVYECLDKKVAEVKNNPHEIYLVMEDGCYLYFASDDPIPGVEWS